MKKKIVIGLVLLLVCGLVFAGGGKEKAGGAGGDAKEITFLNFKIEIDEAVKAFAALYEKQTGVKVIVQSFGGETSYEAQLMSMWNSGREPEIFAIEENGYANANAGGRITNLSNEPWVKDTDVAFIDPANGNVIGFPIAIEGWGLAYNKALLAKAGIDPKTLTNVGAIKAAFAKINSMKAELGIEAAVSMVASSGMTWVTGNHGFNGYLALGLPYNNSTKYIDMLLNGQVDAARLTKFAEYYDLLFKNSIRNTLLTGGYDQQLGDFALGKTVFFHQGNWTDPNFKDLGIDFEMGFVPHAFLDENTDGIFVGAPSWLLVNSKSKNVEEAKKFLAFMAGTPEGHDFMVNKAGMIPAFKSVKLSPSGHLSKDVQAWAAQGKIYSWQQNKMPSGFGMDVLGPIFLELASGNIGTQDFVRLVTAEVAKLK